MGAGRKSDFERVAPLVVAAVRSGATLGEAAASNGVAERTVKQWLTKGRRDPASGYASFATVIDFMREFRAETSKEEPVDDEEVLLHLSKAIRSGNVQAMKVYVDAYRKRGEEGSEKKAPDALADVDELAKRRAGRA